MLNLSILVCTKNSSKTILFCLNSALPLLKAGAELIIVDAKSSDNTIKIVIDFIEMHKIDHYSVITQLKRGLYEGFNLAIEKSNREKILFLHSDDTLKNTQTLILDIQLSTADVVFYGLEIEGAFSKRKWHISNLSSINVKSMRIPPHAGILVSRGVYNKIGKFRTDFKIASDFEWLLRLLNSSNISFSFSSETTYIMRTGGVSNSGLISEIKKILEDIRILKSLGFKFPIYKVFLKKINKLHQFRRI